MAPACQHPGALFLDSLRSEREVPTPGILPSAMLCGQTGPFWQAGLGFCGQGQLWAVASQEACPSVHLIALTRLFSCNKAGWLTQPPAKACGHRRGLLETGFHPWDNLHTTQLENNGGAGRERSHSPSLKGIVFWFLSLAVGHTVTDALLPPDSHAPAPGWQAHQGPM